MKILVVGSDKVYAIENFYVRYLKEQGHNVVHFPAQSIFSDYYCKSTLNKVVFKIGLSRIYRMINDRLRNIVNEVRPDILWVFKGMEIFPNTLKEMKNAGISLVNFNGDNPFIFSGSGSGNSNVSSSINLYDLHFTYNLTVCSELQQRGLRAAILPFGFDLNDASYQRLQNEKEIGRVCFLGNPDIDRAKFIQHLAMAGVPISVYGNSWNKFLAPGKVEINQPVYGEELWRVLRRYRVQLNLMRRHNLDSHNMRTFEIPAVGGIMLAPNTSEHRGFFANTTEAFFFNSADECTALANSILNLSADAADGIRQAARKKCIDAGYSYADRASQALQALKINKW